MDRPYINPFQGKHHSKKTRKKMRESHADVSGNLNPFYGKEHLRQTKKKMREAHLNTRHSPETISRFKDGSRKKENNPFFGKQHTERTKRKMSKVRIKKELSKGRNNPMFGKLTHGKRIKYKGIWMRSSWEVAYAKYLDKLGINWQYEPKTFDLGETTYTPDFYLLEKKVYIEIKGWMTLRTYEKLKRFIQKFSEKKLIILMKEELIGKGVLK